MVQVTIIGLLLLGGVLGHQRSPPGINPNQYQGQQQQHKPPPPPPQQYQQNQQYQGNAPGVPPPQQYQQQQQQFQQPPPPQAPQQFQQPPQQQQPPPPQQQQQQPPPQQQQQQFQQPPPQQPQQQPYQPPAPPAHQPNQPHRGHAPQQNRVLHNPDMNNERDHIKDHLEVPLDTSGMSEQELQYHYFKMHDADNNNQLDGQELIKSLFHWHDESNHDAGKTGQTPPENKLFKDDELVAMIDPILDQDDKNKDGYIDYPEFVQAQRNAAANNAKG